MKVTLTIGIPASGKSTWAKSEVSKDPNIVRINRDDIRIMAFNYVHNKSNESLAVKVRDNLLKEALLSGRDVIIDDTNFGNFSKIEEIIKGFVLNKEVLLEEKSFYLSLEEALIRDSKRSSPLPEGVIESFWNKSQRENFAKYLCKSKIIPVSAKIAKNTALPKAILVDLDGTLCLMGKRNPYDATHCDKDLPNHPILDIVKNYSKDHQIIFSSGREDKYIEPTKIFLDKYLPNINYVLHMRKTSDQRKDYIIKEEIFSNLINPYYNVLFCLDDRDSVVAHYRSLGLTVLQVAPGSF